MPTRLDPACGVARALLHRHRDQAALLVAGSEGTLASVVRLTQDRQVRDHAEVCPRCRSYHPQCDACGFDTPRERHGWMCTRQASRWRDAFPWNWRARRPLAAPPPQPAQARAAEPAAARVVAPASRRAPVARSQVGSHVDPGPPPQPGGIPRVPPRAPPPAPPLADLAAAFAVLGLSAEATHDAVRMAYRVRAMQYHPDRVASLAPEFRAVADTKMREINAAFERIRGTWDPSS